MENQELFEEPEKTLTFIYGHTGSGKTTFLIKELEKYQQDKKKVVLISSVKEYNTIPYLKFEKSAVVFTDDTEIIGLDELNTPQQLALLVQLLRTGKKILFCTQDQPVFLSKRLITKEFSFLMDNIKEIVSLKSFSR